MSFLQRIFEEKKVEVAGAMAKVSLEELKSRASSESPARGFRQSLIAQRSKKNPSPLTSHLDTQYPKPKT